MLKLWNWRKKRKKEKINKKIITFFVRNFLHSSVPKISALCILYFFYLFFICFLERKSTRKKEKRFFFFFTILLFAIGKIKVFNF